MSFLIAVGAAAAAIVAIGAAVATLGRIRAVRSLFDLLFGVPWRALRAEMDARRDDHVSDLIVREVMPVIERVRSELNGDRMGKIEERVAELERRLDDE